MFATGQNGIAFPNLCQRFWRSGPKGAAPRVTINPIVGDVGEKFTDLAVTVDGGGEGGRLLLQEVGMEEWQKRRGETWMGVV